jgi:hypothetical protein
MSAQKRSQPMAKRYENVSLGVSWKLICTVINELESADLILNYSRVTLFTCELFTFYAVKEDQVFNSGWAECICWARQRLQENDAVIRILTARGGEKQAIVVAEITAQCERMIYGGRTFPVKRLVNGKVEV